MNIVTFCHSGTIGDIFASLPAIRQGTIWAAEQRGEPQKALLYLIKNQQYVGPENAAHPTKNEAGESVMLSQAVCESIVPLLLAQDYIAEVKIVNPTDLPPVEIDLDKVRMEYVGGSQFPIQRWYFYVFPQLTCDLTHPWITVSDAEKDWAKGKIIVNRTERYLNENIDYSFLKEYQDDILFFGTMKEYNLFTMRFNLNIRKLPVKNFLELAQAIKQAKFYLGNQSSGYQVAEGMKTPRIVEIFDRAPDVTPFGPNGYDFLANAAVRMYVKELGGYK